MNYTIYDLIERFIDIEKNTLDVYKKIEENAKEKNSKNIEIITRVIRKEEIKHIKYYEQLKEKFNYELNDTIDFYLYDKVVKLLYEFKSQIRIPHIDNAQDLIKYSLEFEKNSISLLLDIQGRLLGNLNDVYNNVYKIISNIIEEERRHEKMFSDLVLK